MADTSPQLHLLSYNTHLFGDALPNGVLGALRRLRLPVPTVVYEDSRRADALIERLRGGRYDLVGLSEVWDDRLAARFQRALRGVYPHSFRPPLVPRFPYRMSSGLLLLSKHPLTSPGESLDGGSPGVFTPFPKTDLVGFDNISGKGVAASKILVGRGAGACEVLVVLTHTQAGDSDRERACRRRNLARVRERIQAWRRKLPVLLLGDLNVVAEDRTGRATPEYRSMNAGFEELGLRDLFRQIHPETPGFTYDAGANHLIPIFAPMAPRYGLRQRLDYVYHDAGASSLTATGARVVPDFRMPHGSGELDLSDHEPLAGSYAY